MIWIYVALAFIAIILLFLFLPIHLTIEYDKNLKLHIKILFLDFSFSSADNDYKSDSKSKIPKKNKNRSKGKKNKNLDSVINIIRKKGIINSLKFISNILKTSGNLSFEILKKINVSNLTFLLKLGGTDAASTAIKYGQVCPLIYSLLGYIISIKSPEIYEVRIAPDFSSENTSFYSKITITITALYFFHTGIKYIIKIKNLFQTWR